MAPACVMMADMGMVLMMVVVPGLVVLGDTLLMPSMVGLVPAPLACVVVMIVVGLPSAEVTSFRMVPAGRGPLVCKGEEVEQGEVDQHHCQCAKPDGSLIWLLSIAARAILGLFERQCLTGPSGSTSCATHTRGTLSRQECKFSLLVSQSLGPTNSPG